MKGSRHNVTILSCCTKAWWIWTGMIMRALVFLSCFKAYRKPSECVMYCTVEQVVGEGDRFRQHVYLYTATSLLYASGSGDLCKTLQLQTGVILELWLATQTHQAWQCVTLPHTHISRCSWSLFMLEIRCCDGRSGGDPFRPQWVSIHEGVRKKQKRKEDCLFPLHLHFIILSRDSIMALSGSISCSDFWNRVSINTAAVSLLSPSVFRASFWLRLLCPSLCH